MNYYDDTHDIIALDTLLPYESIDDYFDILIEVLYNNLSKHIGLKYNISPILITKFNTINQFKENTNNISLVYVINKNMNYIDVTNNNEELMDIKKLEIKDDIDYNLILRMIYKTID